MKTYNEKYLSKYNINTFPIILISIFVFASTVLSMVFAQDTFALRPSAFVDKDTIYPELKDIKISELDKVENSFTYNDIIIELGRLSKDTIRIKRFPDKIFLFKENGRWLAISYVEHKGQRYLKIGKSAYRINSDKINLFDVNPLGNSEWFWFFDVKLDQVERSNYSINLPISGIKNSVELFPANPTFFPSLVPPKVEPEALRFARKTLEAVYKKNSEAEDTIKKKDSNSLILLHAAALLGKSGVWQDYYFAQDFLTWLEPIAGRVDKSYKKLVVDLSDFLHLNYIGCNWEKWDRIKKELKEKGKDKDEVPSLKRSLTLFEKTIDPKRVAISYGKPEDWQLVKVEALTDQDLKFIADESYDQATAEARETIRDAKIVSVPFFGGATTTVKKQIGLHKLVHLAYIVKVFVEKTQETITKWISTAQARIGLILGQNIKSKIVAVTSVGGTKEHDSDRSIRTLLSDEYEEQLDSKQIEIAMQRTGLLLDPETGEALRYSDGHLVTCTEDHLWAFLSILVNKNLVLNFLKTKNDIYCPANGDNTLNYPRAGMIREIREARKAKRPLATVALCIPSNIDRKGGFAAKMTYRNKNTKEEIKQIEIPEASEFPTRLLDDEDDTVFSSIDISDEQNTNFYKDVEKNGWFIEDIFGCGKDGNTEKKVAFNVAHYAVDIRLFISRIFGFNENDEDLIEKLEQEDKQSWVDKIVELGEQVPGNIRPDKSVPYKDDSETVKGYMTEQSVQNFIANGLALLANGETDRPELEIMLEERNKCFIPYKGKRMFRLGKDGTSKDKAKKQMDIVAQQELLAERITQLAHQGIPLVTGPGERVIEVTPVEDIEEIIEINRKKNEEVDIESELKNAIENLLPQIETAA